MLLWKGRTCLAKVPDLLFSMREQEESTWELTKTLFGSYSLISALARILVKLQFRIRLSSVLAHCDMSPVWNFFPGYPVWSTKCPGIPIATCENIAHQHRKHCMAGLTAIHQSPAHYCLPVSHNQYCFSCCGKIDRLNWQHLTGIKETKEKLFQNVSAILQIIIIKSGHL